jgi:hypothetical protein
VWLGERPECVFEAPLNQYHLYLDRNADAQQTMFSASHEAFHRVCTPSNAYHWADEMLAVQFSLFFLERIGQHLHAIANRVDLQRTASRYPVTEMLACSGPPLPLDFYGAAYVVGEALLAACGWDQLKLLGVTRNADGTPSIERWLGLLSGPERARALAALPSTA